MDKTKEKIEKKLEMHNNVFQLDQGSQVIISNESVSITANKPEKKSLWKWLWNYCKGWLLK